MTIGLFELFEDLCVILRSFLWTPNRYVYDEKESLLLGFNWIDTYLTYVWDVLSDYVIYDFEQRVNFRKAFFI